MMVFEPTTFCMARLNEPSAPTTPSSAKRSSEQGLPAAAASLLLSRVTASPRTCCTEDVRRNCCSFRKRTTCHAPWMHMRLGGSAAPGRRSVLSVAKLTLGQEAYYEQQVALGLDDYYASRGESPWLWAGRGAEELGLVGVVGYGDLETMLRRQPGEQGARCGSRCASGRSPSGRSTSSGRVAGGAEAARPRLGLRPRLLLPEERQPAARAHRRRADSPPGQRGARGGVPAALGLSRARGVRCSPGQGRHYPRARLQLREPKQAGELVAELRLVQVPGREPVRLQDCLPVERPPLAVFGAGQVGDNDVRVQVGILRSAYAVTKRRRYERLPSR